MRSPLVGTMVFILGAAPLLGAHAQADDHVLVDDDVARDLFTAGTSAFAVGRYRDALDLFERAYALSERSILLFNIGSAADRSRNDARALEAYEAYLVAHPEAENRAFVEERITTIRTHRTDGASAEPEDALDAPEAPEPPALALEDQAGSPQDDPEGAPSRWWLWTGVGAVVATGLILGIVLPLRGGTGLPDDDIGGVVFTLGVRR
jgi:tetratricopeptide (TPR) repeat protein